MKKYFYSILQYLSGLRWWIRIYWRKMMECLMSEPKPRTIDVRVRKCPNCGRLSDGRYGLLCDCDDASESEFEWIVFVEDLGPERMLAWAIDRLGEDAVIDAMLAAIGGGGT